MATEAQRTEAAAVRTTLRHALGPLRPGRILPSGATVGTMLGVSRVAGWRHLRRLAREGGVALEAVGQDGRQGRRLRVAAP